MSKTTDNQNEIFDVVDEDDGVVGKTTREEANSNKNLTHRSIGVAIFNSRGEMYLQQRSTTKDTDPGKWTISCSGHVGSNIKYQKSKIKNTYQISKIYEKAAHRELQEELGVDLKIEPVVKYLCLAPNETEMVMLYKAVYDGLFKLSKEEIIQGKFFTRKELKEAIKSGEIKLSFSGEMALGKLGWNEKPTIKEVF